MAVTPLRFVGPQQLTTATQTLCTVPDAAKDVINFIHVQNPTSSPIGLTLSINSDGASTRIYDNAPMQPGPTSIFCNHVLEAEEFLAGFASSNALVITIDGEQRTL